MKGARFSRFRPINRLRKPVAENGKCFRCRLQDRVQCSIPREIQIVRAEKNRDQIVRVVQFRQAPQAIRLLQRPPKLFNGNVEGEILKGEAPG